MGHIYNKSDVIEIIREIDPRIKNYLGVKITAIIKRKNSDSHLIKYEWSGSILDMYFRNSPTKCVQNGYDSIEVNNLIGLVREYKLNQIKL